MEEGQILARDGRLVVGAFGRVLVTHAAQNLQLPQFAILREANQALQRASPGGFATLTILAMPRMTRLTEVERSAAQSLAAEFGPHKLAEAFVAEAGGLVGVAIRGLLVTMNLVSRATFPTHVCQDVAEGALWMAPQADVDANALAKFARSLRAEVRPD
jgi:hypothetical protein